MSNSAYASIRSLSEAVRCGFRVGSDRLRFSQHTTADCGPACARLLLALRGLPVSIDLAPATRRDGVSATDLAASLTRAGLPIRLLDPEIEPTDPGAPRIDLTHSQHYVAHLPVRFRGPWKFDPAKNRPVEFEPSQSATLISLCVDQSEDRWRILIAAHVALLADRALRSLLFMAGVVGPSFFLLAFWLVSSSGRAMAINPALVTTGLALAALVSRSFIRTRVLESRVRTRTASAGDFDRVSLSEAIILKQEQTHAQELSWPLPTLIVEVKVWAACGLFAGLTAAFSVPAVGPLGGISLSTLACALGVMLQANLNQLRWRAMRSYSLWHRRRTELEKQPLLVAAVETTLSLATHQLYTYWKVSVEQEQRWSRASSLLTVLLALGVGAGIADIMRPVDFLTTTAAILGCSAAGAVLAECTGLRIGASFFPQEQAACRVNPAYDPSFARPCAIRTSPLTIAPGVSSAFQLHVPSIDIAAGSLTTISGPGGGGKSILMAALAGAIRPTSGVITFVDAAGRGHARPPGTVGFMTERDRWYDGNVIGAIILNTDCRLDRQSVVTAALSAVESLPLALNASALLSCDAIAISSSERKRLRVACALAGSPSLAFLDDPLSGAGCRHVDSLRHALLNLKATRIVVTDDRDLRDAADLQLFCQSGIARIVR